MTLTHNDIRIKADKIMLYKTYTDDRKIDSLLELDTIQYTNLGKESTKSEKDYVKGNSKYIYKLIERINKAVGKLLIRDVTNGS
jgi:hypothetical protein